MVASTMVPVVIHSCSSTAESPFRLVDCPSLHLTPLPAFAGELGVSNEFASISDED